MIQLKLLKGSKDWNVLFYFFVGISKAGFVFKILFFFLFSEKCQNRD